MKPFKSRHNLAVIYIAQGNYRQPIGELVEAIRTRPENPMLPMLLYNLGVACAKDGQRERARRCFRSALGLDPHYERACADLRFLSSGQRRRGCAAESGPGREPV